MVPRKIGIITSPTGSVIQDMLNVLERRFENLHILLFPARVQGEGAYLEMCEAIRYFNKFTDVDVIIVGRGGGSLEDLWVFNEEAVARAIYHSKIPIISAVGHETDYTIADFVADLRAPTPSAAAELVVRDKREIKNILHYLGGRLENEMVQVLEGYRTTLSHHKILNLKKIAINLKVYYLAKSMLNFYSCTILKYKKRIISTENAFLQKPNAKKSYLFMI